MKLIPALLPVCALLLPCALSAEAFEGKVTMKMSGQNTKDTPPSMQWEMKEGFMRMNVASSRGQMSMIMDLNNRQMIMLMPQQQMYMVQSIPQPPPSAAANPKAFDSNVQVTTTKETILGYECTKIVATGPEGSSEIWVTDQLGTFFGMSPGGGPGRRSQVPQGWEMALKGKGFFPMRVVTTANGSEKFRLEVTSVEKVHLPDSEFAAPDGWRKFDLGAIMGGGMPGGYPGGRPPGSN